MCAVVTGAAAAGAQAPAPTVAPAATVAPDAGDPSRAPPSPARADASPPDDEARIATPEQEAASGAQRKTPTTRRAPAPPDPFHPPVIEVSGPRVKSYTLGDEVPFAYHLEQRASYPLIFTGAMVLSSFYHAQVVLTLGAGAFSRGGFGGTAPKAGFVPLAGPYILIANKQTDEGVRIFSVAFGAGQTIGMALLVAGIVYRPLVLVRDDSGPEVLGHEPGDPVPFGYHVEHRTRRGLLAFGVSALPAAYFASTTAGAFLECPVESQAKGCTIDDDRGLFMVPLAGSFFAATRSYLPDAVQASAVLLGVMQAAGMGALIAAVALPGEEILRRDDAGAQRRQEGAELERVLPAFGPEGFGLTAAGRF